VGDGPHDVGAARAAGIRSIGVLWGIGSPVGADVTAHDVGGLRDALAALGILR
jgi:phosphoglycolate phosphatase-like HAD superfamily hydrolase